MKILTSRSQHPSDCLIPDTCNVGIVGRILVTEFGVIALVLWWREASFLSWISSLSSACVWLVWVALVSCALLCGIRRHRIISACSSIQQRILCGALPATIYALTSWLTAQFEFSRLLMQGGSNVAITLFAGVSGFVLQQAFEWRARAYSPALEEARLQALQARIRPHFLFNSLNTALALIRRQPQQAEQVIEDMCDLFRILMRDQSQLISLNDEIRFCEQYLSIEKLRLAERLVVTWDVNGAVHNLKEKIQIPPLILQPLLENAVHYGVEPSQTRCEVKIQIDQKLDKLEIRVTNPVHENSPLVQGNQIALDNIRARLNLLYDIEAGIRADKSDQTFSVFIFIPLKTYARTTDNR